MPKENEVAGFGAFAGVPKENEVAGFGASAGVPKENEVAGFGASAGLLKENASAGVAGALLLFIALFSAGLPKLNDAGPGVLAGVVLAPKLNEVVGFGVAGTAKDKLGIEAVVAVGWLVVFPKENAGLGAAAACDVPLEKENPVVVAAAILQGQLFIFF